MAVILKEPYYVIGSRLSVGAFEQGIFGNEAFPTAALDIFSDLRIRGNTNLTDARMNWGGPSSQTGGNGSVVYGIYNQALGYNSISQGDHNIAAGNGSVSIGRGLVANNDSQAAFGKFNVANVGNVLLVVGDGRDPNNTADAFRVYDTGRVWANALVTNNVITLPSDYIGPLLQSVKADGTIRGVAVDANCTSLYGQSLQLSVIQQPGNVVQPHLTISPQGTTVQSDTIFYGNVQIIGQTYSTVSATIECSDPVLSVAHGYPAISQGTPYDIGLMGERPSGNTAVIWDESRGEWAFIHTLQGSESSTQYTDFTYANLHIAKLSVDDITTYGVHEQQGDLLVGGTTVTNNMLVSNTFTVAGTGQFDRSLLVNGPSVLNTVFVANQVILNQGLYPSQPDSWPVGQVDNRFSRAFFDTIDVYDQLQVSGPSQDTYPARLGGFGEANVYLYTTSPFYQDTVSLYFDKGQSQYPAAKSALVQQADRFSLRTGGVARLTANTVTGNLTVANDLVVVGNLVLYGATGLSGNTVFQGPISGNVAYWANQSYFNGNLLPLTPDAVYIGQSGQRFANAFLDTADILQIGSAPALSIGSTANPNIFIYSKSPTATASITFNNAYAIQQDQTSLRLSNAGANAVIVNNATGNVTFSGDQTTQGNATVTGQQLAVQNLLTVQGNILANTATFSNLTTVANILPGVANTCVWGNAADRVGTLYVNNVDIYDTGARPLRLGARTATNVYIFSDALDSSLVGLTLDKAGNSAPTAKSFWTQGLNNAAIGVAGQPRMIIDNLTGNLLVANDATVASNLSVQGQQLNVRNNLVVAGALVANTSYWANASTFQGPVYPAVPNTVALGNNSARFQQASLQRVDLYDATQPLRVGSNTATNVYLYSDSNGPVGITLDQGGNAAPFSKSYIVQNLSSFSLSTNAKPRLTVDNITGNAAFSSDLLTAANLQVYGQTSTINQDLRVLGRLAANSAYFSNLITTDASIVPFTPNTWTVGGPSNRFATAYVNYANVFNQDGGAQTIGSTQAANLGIFSTGVAAGQTASLFLDKAGVARTVLQQDSSQFSLRQAGVPVLTANNTTANIFAAADLTVAANLVAYGQTTTIGSDSVTSGRTLANTLYVANTTVLAGNLTPVGQVSLGNVNNRMSTVFTKQLDVYGGSQQTVIAGPASTTLTLLSNGGDVGQTVAVNLVQGATSNAAVVQNSQALFFGTQGVPRMTILNTGNVSVANDLAIGGGVTVAQVLINMGNVSVGGSQSRWPLDINRPTERAIGLNGVGWLGANNATQDVAFTSNLNHRFYSNLGQQPVFTISPNGNVAFYGIPQPTTDLTTDIGSSSVRWRQAVVGNVYASLDSTFNGAVVGTLGAGIGAAGLTSNVKAANAYAILQHPSGNTWINSSANGCIRLTTGNVVGATFTEGGLRVGDTALPQRALDVVQDAGIGGTLYTSQVSGYLSSSTILAPNSAGWLQIGNVSMGNGSQVKLSLMGQWGLANAASAGGESTLYIASTANGQSVSGSWYPTGLQQVISAAKLVQVSSNVYSVFVNQGGNVTSYSASASLTNASFSHACQSAADPGLGNSVTVLPQQLILSGFSIIGNSTGVLNNAIGGQPWLFNGNSIIYNGYPSVGIGTNYPLANLDVRGSLNFTGLLLNNNQPLAVAQIMSVSNSFVSNAADPGLQSANVGLAYPSSMRIGDYKSPTGVFEVIQSTDTLRFGGRNGRASDISTSANVMSFSIASPAAAWTFTKLASYSDLGTKQVVATVDQSGSYIQASDARYKHNVADIHRDTTSKLHALRPRSYNVNGSDRLKYGLIAQEVNKVMPEIVHANEAGFLSIDYVGLVPLLLREIQELRSLVGSRRH